MKYLKLFESFSQSHFQNEAKYDKIGLSKKEYDVLCMIGDTQHDEHEGIDIFDMSSKDLKICDKLLEMGLVELIHIRTMPFNDLYVITEKGRKLLDEDLFEDYSQYLESDEEFGDRKTKSGSFINPEGDEYFVEDDDEEYDPFSYKGCGCCPVCTGEKDCECGCPECNYPDELDGLDESKKSGVTASLKKKSKASGIPMGILRKVFAKGMQAWNAGHFSGVAQHQWGMGRVNSFITGAGGARKADAKLWAQAKKAKAKKKKK